MLSPDRANGRNISNGTSLKPLSDVHWAKLDNDLIPEVLSLNDSLHLWEAPDGLS